MTSLRRFVLAAAALVVLAGAGASQPAVTLTFFQLDIDFDGDKHRKTSWGYVDVEYFGSANTLYFNLAVEGFWRNPQRSCPEPRGTAGRARDVLRVRPGCLRRGAREVPQLRRLFDRRPSDGDAGFTSSRGGETPALPPVHGIRRRAHRLHASVTGAAGGRPGWPEVRAQGLSESGSQEGRVRPGGRVEQPSVAQREVQPEDPGGRNDDRAHESRDGLGQGPSRLRRQLAGKEEEAPRGQRHPGHDRDDLAAGVSQSRRSDEERLRRRDRYRQSHGRGHRHPEARPRRRARGSRIRSHPDARQRPEGHGRPGQRAGDVRRRLPAFPRACVGREQAG